MATVDKWRTCLNQSTFCKKLRENNARESNRKVHSESKGLVAINDSDVFIWDEQASHLIFYNLKNILTESDERKERHQILQCTDSPKFAVEWLDWNLSHTQLTLWGQLGITVVELPQKWGKFAEFQGGRDTVSCKCVSVAQHYFAGHQGVKLLEVRWHPASPADSHIVFLTSDNLISIYDVADPEVPVQTLYLGDSEPSFGRSLSRPTISSALGDSVVAFDFGPAVELQKKSKSDRVVAGNQEGKTVWPVYCVKGTGDVVVGYTDIAARQITSELVAAGSQKGKTVWPVYCMKGTGDLVVGYTDIAARPVKMPVQGPLLMHPPAADNYGTDACAILCLFTTPTVVVVTTNQGLLPVKLPVQGPLLMHPPAEDNYGTDACAILCLSTTPTVVVVTTNEGRLHHCLLLPRDPEETTLLSESSYRSTCDDASRYHTPDDAMLYVYETVELELSLATPQFPDNPAPEEIFTCPIHLAKDVASPDRYHCTHAAGIHTVALPWIQYYQEFCREDEEENALPQQQESVVEHLICTRPVPSSPPAPVLGLGVVRDSLIGSVMLALSSDYDFQCLRLSDIQHNTSATTLQSSSCSKSIPSPEEHLQINIQQSDMRHNTGATTLLSSSSSTSIPSPLRKISREPFDERIRRILQRNTSNPLLKSRQTTQLSQQECFQLLSRSTQVFREEYIQKQALARQEIRRRASILLEQKGQQLSELQQLEATREQLTLGAQRLAITCEDCKENQEDLIKRIEGIMRRLQARVPFLSESERHMKQELENMEEKLDVYTRSLEQLRIKRDYQQRQIQQSKKTNQPSPMIKKTQATQLREILSHEGDELADVMKKINQMRVDSSA